MKKYSILMLLAVLSVVACNSNRAAKQIAKVLSVDPPFTNMAIGCNADVIQNEEGGEIIYESGSKLIIPPNAFVDQNGNPIKGDVKVNYREFHSSAEIMTSGIPMNYKKDGEYENFESAGMFEITAEHGTEKVKLAEGKSITCQTVTYEKEENYNFYHYDETSQEWVDLNVADKTVQQDNDVDSTLSDELVVKKLEKPKAPKKAALDLPVFEIGKPSSKNKSARAIGTASESDLWQFAPDYDISKEAMDVVLSGSNWSDYSLEEVDPKNAVYKLELGKDSKEPIYITPVLFGKDYTKAMEKYKSELAEFNKRAKEISDEGLFERKKQNFYRTASIAQLGIHNWDRLMKRNDVVKMEASFVTEEGAELPDKTQVFMLTGEKKQLITFFPSMFGNFGFDPKVDNTILAILPGDRIGVFRKESFKKLPLGKIRETQKHQFVLKSVVAQIAGVKDLQRFIDSL